MTNILTISQLSSDLKQKDEYLAKSETKIIQLKSDLNKAKEQINVLNAEIINFKDQISKIDQKWIWLENEISEKDNHINFMKLENKMLENEKEKFLKGLPKHVTELSKAKLLPIEVYNKIQWSKEQYEKLVIHEKYLERKTMLLKDLYTQSLYNKKSKWNDIHITSDSDPKSIWK